MHPIKEVNILALTRYGRKGASSRMRFEQFIAPLSKFGLQVKVSPLLKDHYISRLYQGRRASLIMLAMAYVRRFFVLFSAYRYDFLWIEKELFPDMPCFFERIVSRAGIRYVVDYDDAIFHNYDLSRNFLRRLLSTKIDAVMRSADMVVCGNDYLAEHAVKAGAGRVKVLPTVIDLDRYFIQSKKPSGPIVIGWMGSSATVKYLTGILPALKILSAEIPIQLRIVGAEIFESGLTIDCRPWSEEGEVEQIQDFDIGIMPLNDSAWERGKCGYKLIQYMACGLPVVASPVGVNKEIIVDGENGFLASSIEDWVNALRDLAINQTLRNKLGDSGRRLVEHHYCLQVIAPQLATIFRDLTERSSN
jgi:glycosyltransferase involved in cell wall biosynthesis